MANTITGYIHHIGLTEAIPYRDKVFYKRELVLDASHYDRFTGNKFENYPKMELANNNCSLLDQFKVGDLVTVSFVLAGRKVEKDGQTSYFTNINAYKVEPFVRQGQNQPPQQPQTAAPSQSPTQQVQAPPAAPNDPYSASQQPFPPAVNENGDPFDPKKGDDDLPF